MVVSSDPRNGNSIRMQLTSRPHLLFCHSARKLEPFAGGSEWCTRKCAPVPSDELVVLWRNKQKPCYQKNLLFGCFCAICIIYGPSNAGISLFAFWEGRQEKESLTQQFWTSLNEMEMRGWGERNVGEICRYKERGEKSVAICPGWSVHSIWPEENSVS